MTDPNVETFNALWKEKIKNSPPIGPDGWTFSASYWGDLQRIAWLEFRKPRFYPPAQQPMVQAEIDMELARFNHKLNTIQAKKDPAFTTAQIAAYNKEMKVHHQKMTEQDRKEWTRNKTYLLYLKGKTGDQIDFWLWAKGTPWEFTLDEPKVE